MKNLVKSMLKKMRYRWHNDIYARINECIALYSESNCTFPVQHLDEFVHIPNGVVNLEGNFKGFFLINNMPEKIALLKSGLDETSKKNIDLYLNRMLYLPDRDLSHFYKLSKKYIDSLYTEEERKFKKLREEELIQYKNNFHLPLDVYAPDVFTFHHGVRFSPNKVKEYIKNKDFIDGGAWIGDSALIFTHYYNPQKIYAFELSPNNLQLFQTVMDKNNIPKDKYQLIPMGLGDKKEEIFFDDIGGLGVSALWKGNTKAELTDLDSFVEESNLNVGFIKADLEGYGLKALKGMANTIRTHRPVLSLAIYHSTKEFFEMKPLLEQIVKDENYIITIRQFHVFIENLTEITLFAYPSELDKTDEA